MLVKAFEDARLVVRWLNKQQKVGGGYGSTQVTPRFSLSIILIKVHLQRSLSRDCIRPCFFPQATIIVYQAVAEYWANAKEPDYDLNVDVLLPGRSGPDKYKLNRENHYTTRTSKVKY